MRLVLDTGADELLNRYAAFRDKLRVVGSKREEIDDPPC
jgi:hypothetical protein